MVQPLGVDTDLFHPGRADPQGLRRTLGLAPDTRMLGFAGRPAREKNIDVILEAADRLGAPYHLLLIGAGAGSRPQPNATVLDYRRDPKEVARLIASCDAFVHANAQEAFGLVVLEAMACGLPIVGVGSGGVSELVDEAVGQLAEYPIAADLAEAIDALFQRDMGALSRAARERVERRHGWNSTFEGLSGLYGRLCEASAARPEMLAGWC
jgi:alpha-1,6-mannosyltransferase